MQFTACTDITEAYWLMRSFIDSYGVETFWAYKNQQMMQKYGKILSDAEKIVYINRMIESESNFE